MRKQFVKDRWMSSHADFMAAMDPDEVRDLCPWQAVIVEVTGGWMVFESLDDYEVWAKQE